jgi:HK97 family phage portal protein
MNIKQAWKALWGQKALSTIGFRDYRVIGNGTVSWITDDLDSYVREGFAANDIIYSIVNITQEKVKLAPWNAYKIKDEGALKLYQSEIRKKGFNYKTALDLRTKAMELYTGDSHLNNLLKHPNEQQSFEDLVAESSAAKMLMGNRYIQGKILGGGLDSGKPGELWLLPSQFMTILSSKGWPPRVTGYEMMYGDRIPFTKEEVLHDKTANFLYDPSAATHLYGMPPLKAAIYNITRSKYAKEASTKAFENGGPGGVLYVDDDRLGGDQSVEQAQAVKTKWNEEYRGINGTKKIVVSGYKVGWEQMGLSPTDLAIIEAEKWDLNMLCGVFNFPIAMLHPDRTTFNNGNIAEAALTSRTALPLLNSFKTNFNRKLQDHWGYAGKGIVVDYDLSVYTELQPNYKEMAEWLNKMPIPVEMKYSLMQLDIPEYMTEEVKRMIYIPTGSQLIEDLNNLEGAMNQVDEELDNQKPKPKE